jgi:hypothetical protein
METLMKRILITLALILGLSAPSLAQTTLTTTTLSNAITSASGQTVVVLSATTVDVGTILYIDHEAMQVNAINGTTLSVSRGVQGTAANTHAGGTGGATVIIAPKASLAGNGPFGLSVISQSDPPAGTCTPAQYRYLPIINAVTGNVWQCRYIGTGTVRVWAATNIVAVNGQTSLLVSLQ